MNKRTTSTTLTACVSPFEEQHNSSVVDKSSENHGNLNMMYENVDEHERANMSMMCLCNRVRSCIMVSV